MEALLIGKFVENYKITGILGKGGMSTVFKALDQSLDREVALKIMESRLSRRSDFIKRFRTEGRSQARLRHPNIVNIYAMRESDEGLYIVMEYVPGGTLKKRIAQEGPLTPPDALVIAKQIVLAIKHAHARGIIHRDIKPANILLDNCDFVKVTDFGLAKMQHDFGFTLTGMAVGTLGYAPPEQLKSLKNTDQRSDIYSIGMTLYEMLVGKLPFGETDSNLTVQLAIMEGNIPSPDLLNPDIPPQFVRVIRKATATEPEDRYQSAMEMLADLEELELLYKKVKALPAPKENSKPPTYPLPAEPVTEIIAEPISETVAESPTVDIAETKVTEIYEKEAAIESETPETERFAAYRRKRHSPLWFAVFVLIAIIGFIGSTAMYYSNSQMLSFLNYATKNAQLSIYSDPENADVFLNGEHIGETPLENYPVASGNGILEIEKNGYRSIDTVTVFQPGNREIFSLNMQESADEAGEFLASELANSDVEAEKFGRVKVISSPAGASIRVNGKLIKNITTPHIFEKMPPGNYDLELRKKGYEPYRCNITVVPMESRPVRVAMRALKGGLKITSNPPGAAIWVNGKQIRGLATPAELTSLRPGRYNIVLKKEGYRDYATRVKVKNLRTADIRGNMEPLYGELSVVTLPFGSIFVNGEPKKRNTNIPYNENLPEGKYIIKAVHPQHGVWTKTTALKSGSSQNFLIDFNKKISLHIDALDVQGRQIPSRIYVDGQFVHKITPATIQVRVGFREIEVRQNGYVMTALPKRENFEESPEEALVFSLRKL